MIEIPDSYLKEKKNVKANEFHNEVLKDYWYCLVSRECSMLGRREVLTGKAKFGILGDGKELPQVAMARVFKKGDWRSGYYRDQTFMFAIGKCTVESFFAQLYSDTENDPFSGGRQMNSHFATPNFDKESGEWLNHTLRYNVSSDISCTGGQMGRALGIAMASKKYRNAEALESEGRFSNHGNEISFCTIGDSSTSEGAFWETMNAAAVQKVPLLVSVWDDGYGISVPTKYQTVKSSISKAMEGFLMDENGDGIYIYTVKGWDYPELCSVYERASQKVRREHVPALIHVQQLTQPLGHSTSGSHERYKSRERLGWEKEHDCIAKMEEWMLKNGIISTEQMADMQKEAKNYARKGKNDAWSNYLDFNRKKKDQLLEIYNNAISEKSEKLDDLKKELDRMTEPLFFELVSNAKRLKVSLLSEKMAVPTDLYDFIEASETLATERYHNELYSDNKYAAVKVAVIEPEYSETSKVVNGFQVLNTFFDKKLEINPRIIAFGEDVGHLGDVNQGFAGLQSKYGKERIFDTGIREWSIMGMAIGAAMRGLRPIAEIQYLDYLLFGLPPLSDDLATLRYRTNGIQRSPAIIRTRGHRLEGIWHSGSPLGMILGSLRGMYVVVPRNMVQAAGFYNTFFQCDDPAIVIECLNGYRLKEKLPDNIGTYTIPLGVPEILIEGHDITLVTYGSCVRESEKAISMLNDVGVSVELIDVQTLIPFDLEGIIGESIQKTNRVIFVDEDVPGGATAYMMQKVVEEQNIYQYLDSPPATLSASAHRPPFGSDGDYFSKPNPDSIFDAVYEIMQEAEPDRFQ